METQRPRPALGKAALVVASLAAIIGVAAFLSRERSCGMSDVARDTTNVSPVSTPVAPGVETATFALG